MNVHLRSIQSALLNLGHDPGPIDGLWGRRTKAGLESLIDNSGQPLLAVPDTNTFPVLPWIEEAMPTYGWHETRDNRRLREYLRSDGKTLGDPDALPWCGDWVETVIKNSLPSEPFTGALGENPYWARNWTKFGKACPAVFGAVISYSRGSGGHVGILVGERGSDFLTLGGNQGDRVNVVPIAKRRMLATRWPLTYPMHNIRLQSTVPIKGIPSSDFGPRSTNEA